MSIPYNTRPCNDDRSLGVRKSKKKKRVHFEIMRCHRLYQSIYFIISGWHMPARRIQAICCPCFILVRTAYSNKVLPIHTYIQGYFQCKMPMQISLRRICSALFFCPLFRFLVQYTPNTKLKLQHGNKERKLTDPLDRSQIEHSFPLLFYFIFLLLEKQVRQVWIN